MILLASLLILMSAGGSFSHGYIDENSCYQREWMKCYNTANLPSEYPQTPEDLMAVCRTFISVESCKREAKENCDDEPDTAPLGDRPMDIDYLKSTCQQDNPTFKVVASNLPCVERALKSQRWLHWHHFFSEKNLEAINTQALLLVGEGEDYESELQICLTYLLEVTAHGVIMGYHCGEEMKEAAEEIVAHILGPVHTQCSAEQLEKASPLLRLFEGLLVEEIELGNNLKKKRK